MSAETAPVEVRKGNEVTASVKLQAGALVKKWSAEAPWRYVLVGELVDAKDNVLETFSTIVGFRKIESNRPLRKTTNLARLDVTIISMANPSR